MATTTLWGTADRIERYARGLSWVSTPSHGGLRVSQGFADRHLSPDAVRIAGQWYGNYLYFEEDCAYAIAWLELPQYRKQIAYNLTLADACLLAQRWYPSYTINPS